MSKNRHLTFEKGALNIQRRGGGGEGVRPHPTHPFRYATDLITRNLYVAQIQRLIVWSLWPVVKHKSIANLWESVFSVFWFYNAWENWMCRIGWTITYHSLKYSVMNSILISMVTWIGSVYLAWQNLTKLSAWELHLFPVPTLYESDRISTATLDNDLLSAKIATNGPPACTSFSILDVPSWVFVVVQAVVS